MSHDAHAVDLVILVVAASGVIAVECLAGPMHPLDPLPRWGLALLVTALALGGFAGFGRLVSRRAMLPAAVVLWGLYACTEAAHAAGGSPWMWSLLVLPMAAAANAWPRASAGCIPLAALGVVLVRPPMEAGSPSAGSGVRLLVITVDTIRADAGLFDAAGLTAADGWWTATALSAAPWTPPSMTSLWLGHDVTDHGGGIEVDGRVSLPRGGMEGAWPARWAEAGAMAEAVVSNPHLRAEMGFREGFRAFWHADGAREQHLVLHTLDATLQRITGADPYRGRTRDDRVVAHALSRIDAGVDVLWVHLLEPHEYDRRTSSTLPRERRTAYQRAVKETAARVARLVKAASHATIVVVGDHGESLGENLRWGHGRQPVAEVLEVPLAIRHAPTKAQPPSAPAALPSLGSWLADLATHPERPYAGGELPQIAGVRGLPLRRYRWRAGMRLATPVAEDVVPGPLGSVPDETVRQALEELGYVEGSGE